MAQANGVSKPAVSATAATDPAAVPALIKEIAALGENFTDGSDEDVRLDLLIKARTLWKALETPRETMIRHCWAQVRLDLDLASHLTSFFLAPETPRVSGTGEQPRTPSLTLHKQFRS